ncbi:hypothetical protein WJX84_001996 [Apatococcus fuscideae]|uniref:Uncharacterized protein n=1 Tax=Apatococcus fuscideae TaxID=2026836 RepID=A0AAW1TF29_9CHLO
MSLSALLPKYLFGLRKDVKDNVHYVDDVTIVYPAGHNIVIYWTDSKTQKFVPGNLESEDITAITLSPNKRFLAMAERAEKGMITIFDLQTLKRRKVLVSVDTGSKEIVSLAFSPDTKLLAAQGGPGEWNLVVWSWEKAKQVAVIKASNQMSSPIHQCLFSPGTANDSGIVSVAGNTVFKCFRLADGAMKQLPSALLKHEAQKTRNEGIK